MLIRCNGSADIGLGGGVHAEIASRGGGHRTCNEGNGGVGAQWRDKNADYKHSRKGKQHLVFTVHEHHGAKVNLVCDAADLLSTRFIAGHYVVNHERNCEAYHPENGGQSQVKAHRTSW